jgi:hypothetical protein
MLDQKELAHLPAEEKARYTALEHLFNSEGWVMFLEHIQGLYIQSQQQLILAPSWEQNRIHAGELRALLGILNLEDNTEKEFKSMVSDIEFAEEDDLIEAELEYE